MIGQYFSAIMNFLSEVLNLDFGLGISMGSLIIAFFTLLAFIRFFIRPLLGGNVFTSSNTSNKDKSKGKVKGK